MFGGAFAGLLCEPFGLIIAIKFLVEIFSDYRSNNSFNLGFWNRHEILQSWDRQQVANFAICFRNNLRIKWCYQLPDACVIRW